MTDSSLPFITVAMPVRNEENSVQTTLADILRQDYPPDSFEVIVADGESTDRTREIVKEISRQHPHVILMPNPGHLPSSGRNVGFKNGRGDLFLVIDGHCRIPNNKLLKNVVGCFERSGAQCLGRPQPFIVTEKPTMERAIALARGSWLGHSLDSYIHSSREEFVSPVSVGCVYKREVFEKIGLVDESFDACEDVEFNYRVEKAGFKTFFSPKIAVYYSPRKTLAGLWRQLTRYGIGRSKFMLKHPETVTVTMILPALFIAAIVLGLPVGFVHTYLWWVYLSVILFYLAVVLVESVRLGADKGPGFISKIIVAFAVIHGALGIGLMRGIWQKIFQTKLK
jgi:glycosyltransferase involved in cell wall biosynthesis